MQYYIEKYFPNLSEKQKTQLENFESLLKDWNEKINVVSRKDTDNLELHHILHSLAIAKYISFSPETQILDLGTGGGLPGIPLAILFPEVNFLLLDRIGKKILVAKEIAKELGLENVECRQADLGEVKEKFDFIVTRGVMPQNDIVKSGKKNISSLQKNAIPNGVISLKGGDLQNELKFQNKASEIIDIQNYFEEPFFETKKIVYTPV